MVKAPEQLFCSIEGCNDILYAKGLCKKCYDKQWREDNKEYKAEYDKQWLQDNREHMKKYYKRYQEQYRQTFIGKASIKAYNHNYRAMTKDLTKETVQRVYEDNIKQFGTLTCILCGKPVEFKDSSLDHLTPLSRGGSNDYENFGVAHLKCNIKKRAMTLEEWYAKNEEAII